MVYKKYILTTYRLLMEKWWLSLIKMCSMTMGILSFLLVWLFYVDQQPLQNSKIAFVQSCSAENILILSAIIFITISVYFLILKSQMTFRYKEFFVRKLYGETGMGIITILLIETAVFMLATFLISLVLIDQVAPIFNILTEKNVNTRQFGSGSGFLAFFIFFVVIGTFIGIFPSLRCARRKAVDLLKKLPE